MGGMSAEGEANVALVTKTLVHNAARTIEAPAALTWPAFLDLSSLCEATVILDRLMAIDSSDVLPSFELTGVLRQAGLLEEFVPKISPTELEWTLSRLPQSIQEALLPPMAASAVNPDAAKAIDDLRDDRILDEAGAVTRVDYEPGFDDLITRLQRVPTYPSLDPRVDVSLRMLRSTLYLVTATAHGMDYFPDFDRAPFVPATVKRLYESLPMQLYDRIAAALQGHEADGHELVSEWTLETTLPIPPVTAIVLSRSASVDEIPARLLAVREEFSSYREHFRRFKAELRAADTLKERRRLRRKYQQLLEAASSPDAEIVTAQEVLNLAEKTVKAAAAPQMPTSYSAELLTQPAEWLRRWWLRRPLAVLFRIDSKLPRLPEYRNLIARLWGTRIDDRVLAEVAAHGRHVRELMSAEDG
jgi:hypothetical protein